MLECKYNGVRPHFNINSPWSGMIRFHDQMLQMLQMFVVYFDVKDMK